MLGADRVRHHLQGQLRQLLALADTLFGRHAPGLANLLLQLEVDGGVSGVMASITRTESLE
jgi:hypothetical protein